MFLRVGMEYSEEYCKQEDWYKEHSWTQEEEADFQQWMIACLRKRLRWTKNTAMQETTWFLMRFGWSWKSKLTEMETIKT